MFGRLSISIVLLAFSLSSAVLCTNAAPQAKDPRSACASSIDAKSLVGEVGQSFGPGVSLATKTLGTPLDFSVYLGGSGLNGLEPARAVAVDSSGAIYLAGEVASADFPTTPGAFDRQLSGFSDGFVTKLSPDGKQILYSTLLGGSDVDLVKSIAVDESGAVYVCGDTASMDFPTTPGAFDTVGIEHSQASRSAFVAKLAPNGRTLIYSTFLEGSSDGGTADAIAIDASGRAFVGGTTRDRDFPVTPGAFDTVASGGGSAYALRLNATGSSVEFATFIEGSDSNAVRAIAIDADGSAVVAGDTTSVDFPVVAALDDEKSGGQDAFVAKFNPDMSALVFSTYIGGERGEFATGVAIDGSGDVYVTGSTTSSDFRATVGAFDEALNGVSDSFVLKMSSDGRMLVYSSYLGGGSGDVTRGIAVDKLGTAFVTGTTTSTNFPTTENAGRRTLNGEVDVFVTGIVADGSALEYSTYLGGSDEENPYALAIDTHGGVFVCGESSSPDFPEMGYGSREGDSAFVARIQVHDLIFEVDSCSPPFASRRQKLDVTVHGSLFEAGATVSFGDGVKVSSVTVESPFTLRVRLKVKKNATVGSRDVVVTNPNGAMAQGEAVFEVR